MSFFVAQIYDALVAHTERLCLADWRRELVSKLPGSVLEIGSGTGRNLEYYGTDVERLVLTEPDPHMRHKLEARVRTSSLHSRIELCDCSAEHLPFEDCSFDTVVSTLVLCSVSDPTQCIGEAHRLLRPGGKLLLIEHVLGPEGSSRRRWQQRLNPIWSQFSTGCQLNRDPRPGLDAAGFRHESLVIDELRGAPGFLRTVIRGSWVKPTAVAPRLPRY